MHKRLFFALWPDAVTRQQCSKLAKSLHACGRPVVASNLHVTLVFLGATDERRQQALMRAAAELHPKPMTLTFDRLAYWKKPAVVCLTAQHCDPNISWLVDALRCSAIDLGMTLDDREYRPHVTLLRKAGRRPETVFPPIIWRSNDFCLVESVSTPSGVDYRVIQRWPRGDDCAG